METGPGLKVSSDRLVKPGIEPATPGLQGKLFIHYTTAAPTLVKECVPKIYFSYFLTKTYVVGTQKNRLNETVLLSTQSIF